MEGLNSHSPLTWIELSPRLMVLRNNIMDYEEDG